ncbi:MAG TPA: pilus assembly protein N-terminal domain-containing protein [Candidatus Binatia bacterium]|jgi:pilus assembly protein CpaC
MTAVKQWSVRLVILAALVGTQASVLGQDVPPSITVTVNKSLIFRVGEKATRVSVTQPEIAEVSVVAPDQILINGKSVGATSLIVWNQQGGAINFDLLVVADIAALQRQFKLMLPGEAIQVSTSGTALVLRGEVSNEVIYDKVLEIAQTYLPPVPAKEVAPAPSQTVTVSTPAIRLPQTGTAFAGGGQLAFTEEAALTDSGRWGNRRSLQGIIDLLVIREIQEVQLDVIVAEVSLTKLRDLGLDFAVLSGKTAVLSRGGTQAGFPAGSLLSDPSTFPPTTTFGGGTSGVVSWVGNRFAMTNVFRLFQNRDVTQILAQPRLVMKNGRSGGFLAGGEFPIPIATRDQVTVEFKPFGVRLDFVPTITWSKTIDLRVFPEVSEIDQSVSVTVSGVSVPGLKVRRSVNRVEMHEGETLIIGGLLDRKTLRDLTKIPFLGDIPILGTIFRSTRFRDEETELIFVITPKIVKPLKPGEKPEIPSVERYDDPDMRQVPLVPGPVQP